LSPACRAKATTWNYDATTVAGGASLFFTEGFEHSLTSHAGAGWALTPWTALQEAARDALAKLERGGEAAPKD
jgi:hypothetical protein